MNKKERLMAVLHHQMPDHIPAGFWFHFDGEKGRGESCVRAHIDFYRKTDIDFVKIMSDNLGYPLRYHISCADDWNKVEHLDESDPFFTDSVARCKAINDAIGEECFTYYNFFSPINIIRERDIFDAGVNNYNTVAEHIRQNPTAVKHAMTVVAEDHVRLAKKIIETGGCLGIYQSLQGAELGWLSKEEYESTVKPADLLQLYGINSISRYNIIHMCSWAGTSNHLDYWKEYPAAVKNWGTGVEKLSLSEGSKFFGKDCLVLGGLDNRAGHPLVSGSKADIRAEVKRVLEEMKGTPFILGADCTVPNTIDLERIRMVVKTAREDNAV